MTHPHDMVVWRSGVKKDRENLKNELCTCTGGVDTHFYGDLSAIENEFQNKK